MGFRYSCVVDGKSLAEATAANHGTRMRDDDPLFTARVIKYETSRDHAQPTTAISWYLVAVTSVATGREATRVHRRFRDFVDLDETVTAAFAGHHMRSSMPHLPSKKIKLVQDHLDPSFLEQRRAELDAYVDRLCRVPHVWSTPGMEPFFGVASNAREYSVIFKSRTLGFTVGKCGPKKSPEAGDTTYEPPDFPAFVANIAGDDLLANSGAKVGDLVSKISGKPTCNWLFKAVVNAVKDSPRPLIVHFIGTNLHATTGGLKNLNVPVVTAAKPTNFDDPPIGAPSRPPPRPPADMTPDRPPPRPPVDDGDLFAPPSRPPPTILLDEEKEEPNPFADAEDITTL